MSLLRYQGGGGRGDGFIRIHGLEQPQQLQPLLPLAQLGLEAAILGRVWWNSLGFKSGELGLEVGLPRGGLGHQRFPVGAVLGLGPTPLFLAGGPERLLEGSGCAEPEIGAQFGQVHAITRRPALWRPPAAPSRA
jgi:hypothetical protein